MMERILPLIGLSIFFFHSTRADPVLINAQVIYRHGDRTPLDRSKANMYPESYWRVPRGSVTTKGMKQQYETGLKLKSRYIDKYHLVSKFFSPYETLVLSAMDDRCLQSAVAQMAGFYSEPDLGEEWPFNWMPVPIHTGSFPDRIFEPAQACPKYLLLKKQRSETKAFKEAEEQYEDIIMEFVKNTGEKWKTLDELSSFVDAMVCAGAHNLTFPDWLSRDQLSETRRAINKHIDFFFGHELNGERNLEVVRLRAGPIMEAIISNFTHNSTHKYYAYSAHDSTLLSILTALGKRTQYDVLGADWPEYAATMVFELWKMDDEELMVKFLYTYNAEDKKFHDFTSSIDGCPDEGMCPVNSIINHTKKFIPKDINMECAVKDKKGLLHTMLIDKRAGVIQQYQ